MLTVLLFDATPVVANESWIVKFIGMMEGPIYTYETSRDARLTRHGQKSGDEHQICLAVAGCGTATLVPAASLVDPML